MGIPKGGVAFFDSGVGGLTVLATCRAYLPRTRFYYYGDNAHAPYGNLSPAQIQAYAFAAFDKIAKYEPKAAVIACNTVTAVCADALRKRYPFPIVGAEPAVLVGGAMGGECFVLATKATATSERFRRLCLRAAELFPSAKIRVYPMEELAGEIERRLGREPYDFTSQLPEGKPASVVLGCTHYVYIREQIERFYGCPVVDGNDGIARRLQTLLQREEGEGLWEETSTASPPSTTDDHARASSEAFKPPTGEFLLDFSPNCDRNFDGVFFLGGRKTQNKRLYEQMFVLKVGKRG